MELTEYMAFAGGLAREAKVEDGLHQYFLQHRERLWKTASHFDIWNLRGKKILEIGPFFSYTPFVLREQGNEVSVMEGEDPAVYPLKPLYEKRGIEFKLCDLFQSFGSASVKEHRLPFGDNTFDAVCCWETMEHFNFNPVGFVRDVQRVLKPGGEAYITAPNVARLENRVRLLLGKEIATSVGTYEQNYNYAGGNFLGFHWREYVLAELRRLYESQGFSIVSARNLLTFQNYPTLSASKKLRRLIGRMFFTFLPSGGSLCAIVARKTG
jgi:SAM-dependent methyltransferase